MKMVNPRAGQDPWGPARRALGGRSGGGGASCDPGGDEVVGAWYKPLFVPTRAPAYKNFYNVLICR